MIWTTRLYRFRLIPARPDHRGVSGLLLSLLFRVAGGVYLLFWGLSQVFSGTLSTLSAADVGGVAWWAHVGGFVSGMLLYRLFILRPRDGPRRFERDEVGIEGVWAR